MNNQFCKIFNLRNHQVLVTKGFNTKEEMYYVTKRVDFEGLDCSMSEFFKSEKNSDKYFEKFSFNDSLKYVEQCIKFLEENPNVESEAKEKRIITWIK